MSPDMNYPFLYKILDRLNVEKIKEGLVYGSAQTVWADWQLQSIESDIVKLYLKQTIPHLNIFNDSIYVSDGTQSNFHIDRYHAHHLLHRILIPLDNNFKYEWIVDEKKITYTPELGEVILFNNMVPHRFISNNNERREVLYLDMFDPLVEDILKNIKGNYSAENAILDKKYKAL